SGSRPWRCSRCCSTTAWSTRPSMPWAATACCPGPPGSRRWSVSRSGPGCSCCSTACACAPATAAAEPMRSIPRRKLKNLNAEAAQFRRRAMVGFIAIALALLGLATAYFRLQVLQHEEYQLRSEANRIKPRPIVPARGLITDRNGRLLADNVPAYRLELVPEQVGNLEATLQGLAELVELDEEDIARFHETRRATRAFRPIPLKLRLTEAELSRLAVNRHRFPGVEVVPYLIRRYPYGELFSHV